MRRIKCYKYKKEIVSLSVENQSRMIRIQNIKWAWICMLMGILAGCSTSKNTAMTRLFHSTTTRYNIHFNGRQSFEEGINNIHKSNKDDYTNIIPLYPISNHESASAATSQMDISIEKCRKAIKLHSIQKKPKRDPKKWHDPEYQAFYNQTEFNEALDEAWMMLAKSEFYKADFIGAIGTFTYVMRHYANDKDIVAQCQLWMARSYAEMGWLYEAEDLLAKVNQDELKRDNSMLYAEVYADLLLKKQLYKEAIPFVELAAKGQRKKCDKYRFDFVLGQLYQQNGDADNAIASYRRVVKRNPPVEMDFNARLRMNELTPNKKTAIKSLLKMAKDYKYKDQLDQIYTGVGNLYLAEKDTLKAVEHYTLAIEKSTQNNAAKVDVLLTLGDLYYSQRKYAEAQPCYADAVPLLPADAEDYARVTHLSSTLGELVVEQESALLQDSLQRLAKMPEEERMQVVEQIIADLIKAEKEAEEKALIEAKAQEDEGLVSVNTQNMIGNMGTAEWYFYNQSLLTSGRKDFKQKWGNRKLEDNWRRASKAMVSSFQAEPQYDEEGNLLMDSTTTTSAIDSAANDPKNPIFYLRQIPTTPEMLQASNETWSTALYKMGLVAKDKVKDLELALQTFDEMEHRFPEDERMCEIYFQRYLITLQLEQTDQSEQWRLLLLNKYPDCERAKVLKDPNYIQRMKRMYVQQDSLYTATYKAYLIGDYPTVTTNKLKATEEFPQSKLMPKFYFLNALAIAKTQTPDAFGDALRDMIEKFPQSEVSAMAKDMLGLMNQGLESKKGDSHGSLLTRREEEMKQEEDSIATGYHFVTDASDYWVVLIMPNPAETVNKVLYEVALFNFSQFLIKEFDMEVAAYNSHESMLKITGFDSYKETSWYQGLLSNNADLNTLFQQENVRILKIAKDNLELLLQGILSEDEYLLFERQKLTNHEN